MHFLRLVIAFYSAFCPLIKYNYNWLCDRFTPADRFLQLLRSTSHFSTFSIELLCVPVRYLIQHYAGENIGFSPNGVKCVLHRIFNVSMHEKHRFMNLSFRVHFDLSRKVDITTECSCSNFVQLCSKYFIRLLFIKLFFFRYSLFWPLNALVDFVTSISCVHLSKLVHTLLGREIRV